MTSLSAFEISIRYGEPNPPQERGGVPPTPESSKPYEKVSGGPGPPENSELKLRAKFEAQFLNGC